MIVIFPGLAAILFSSAVTFRARRGLLLLIGHFSWLAAISLPLQRHFFWIGGKLSFLVCNFSGRLFFLVGGDFSLLVADFSWLNAYSFRFVIDFFAARPLLFLVRPALFRDGADIYRLAVDIFWLTARFSSSSLLHGSTPTFPGLTTIFYLARWPLFELVVDFYGLAPTFCSSSAAFPGWRQFILALSRLFSG